MPQPTTSSLHIDSALTNISVANLQDPMGFIASRVFPNIPVQKQSDKYFIFDRSFFNRDGAKKRAPGTRAAMGGYEVSSDSYFCEEWAEEKVIPDEVRSNADPSVPVDRSASTWLTHQMLISREVQFVSNFIGTSKWGTDITGVASSPASGETIQWSDTTSGDPIGDVRTAIDTVLAETGIKPNLIVMGRKVFSALIDHPDIQGRINGGATTSQPSIANLNLLAQIFEVDEVVVSYAIKNSAAEGDTASNDFIMGKQCLVTYRNPAPGIMEPSAGYIFNWAGYMGGMNEFGYVVDTRRDEDILSDIIRARQNHDMKLVSTELGYFFDSIVA